MNSISINSTGTIFPIGLFQGLTFEKRGSHTLVELKINKIRHKNQLIKQYNSEKTLLKDASFFLADKTNSEVRHFFDLLLDVFDNAQIGIELTPKNSMFTTILGKEQELEIHIEYFLNETEYDKKILFNIFEGDNSIATGWDSLEKSLDRIKKYVNKPSLQSSFGIPESSFTEAGV